MGFGKSAVFEETYKNYLEDIKRLDLKSRAEILGGEMQANCLHLP